MSISLLEALHKHGVLTYEAYVDAGYHPDTPEEYDRVSSAVSRLRKQLKIEGFILVRSGAGSPIDGLLPTYELKKE